LAWLYIQRGTISDSRVLRPERRFPSLASKHLATRLWIVADVKSIIRQDKSHG